MSRKTTGKTDALPLWDFRLRPYQKECHQKVRDRYRAGEKATLVDIATGLGKTAMFVLLPKEGARILVIVPTVVLVGQTVKQILRLRDCQADVEQADFWATPESPFVVACWDSLKSQNRYQRFLGKVDLVVVDEAHRNYSEACRAILQSFIVSGARVLGVTATAYRGDKVSLLGTYESLAYSYGMRQAIDDGWLVPPVCRVHYVKSLKLEKVAEKSKRIADFHGVELATVMQQEPVIHEVANLIRTFHRKGTKGIVFCASIAQATAIRDICKDRYGIAGSLVHSDTRKMSAEQRDEEMAAYTDGPSELVFNVGVLCEGFDYPPCSEIFLARPTKSLARFIQMLGRCTRTLDGVLDNLAEATPEERKAAIAASGKPCFCVHDLTDSSRSHQILSAVEVLAQGGSEEVKSKVKRHAEDKPMTLEEIDADIAAEIREEMEIQRLEMEAEKARRKPRVLDITFDSESRDLFSRPDRDTPKRREFYCPLKRGKYGGQPLRAIPHSYLSWMLREANLTPFWKDVVQREINKRDMKRAEDVERGFV